MTYDQMLVVLGNNGLAILLLGVVGFAIRSFMIWLAPEAQKLFNEHILTMSALRESSQKQTQILDVLHTRVDENYLILKDIHRNTSP